MLASYRHVRMGRVATFTGSSQRLLSTSVSMLIQIAYSSTERHLQDTLSGVECRLRMYTRPVRVVELKSPSRHSRQNHFRHLSTLAIRSTYRNKAITGTGTHGACGVVLGYRVYESESNNLCLGAGG